MTHRALSFIAACCTLVLALGSPAAAQNPTGTLSGVVTDPAGAVVPALTVQVKHTDSGRSYTGVTDAQGTYRVVNIQPDLYVVTVEASGFAPVVIPDIVIRAGLNLTLDIGLKVKGQTETIQVTADNPLLESISGTLAVNVSGDLKRAIPLTSKRDWLDGLLMVPGVVGTATAFRVHGTEFDAHVLMIDGADVASANSNDNTLVQLSQETMQDMQVKTAGMDAAAPLGYGAVVTLATQSGTNAYRGALGFVWQPKNFNSNNLPGGTSAKTYRFQPDLGLGGPIKRNSLWFFGSYRYENAGTGLARTAAQLSLLKALFPAFEPFDNKTEAHDYFAKITGQLWRAHQFTAFYQYDKTPNYQNSNTAVEPFGFNENGGPAANLRMDSVWGNKLISTIGVSYNHKGLSNKVDPTKPFRPVNMNVVPSGNVVAGTGTIATLDNSNNASTVQDNEKLTVSADATYFKTGWIGTHSFQVGAYLQPLLHSESRTEYVNNGFISEQMVLRNPNDPSQGVRAFSQAYSDTLKLRMFALDSSDYAFYIQDAWRPHARLTVNAGVRVDLVRHRDLIFNLPVAKSTNVGPRLGINYAITKDHRNIIHATAVKVHDAPSGNAAPSVSGNVRAGLTQKFDVNGDGSFETEVFSPGQSVQTAQRSIDANAYEQPHIDEWTLGFARQFKGQLSLDATVVRRLYKDRPTLVEYNAIYDGGVFRGYRDVANNMLYKAQNNVWNTPVYTDFELTASKRTSRMQIMASYTRQWRHLEGGYQPNDPAAIIEPNAFANDRNIGNVRPSLQATFEANSLQNATLPAGAQWTDHQGRIAATVNLPWDFVVATSYVIQSGRWSGVIIENVTPDPAFGPPSLVLSNGRSVTNPLATATRFAFDTRGEGQFQADAWVVWNARVGRNFRFGMHKFELAFDAYNVTNRDGDTGFLTTSTVKGNANYQVRAGRQTPRSGTISLRYTF